MPKLPAIEDALPISIQHILAHPQQWDTIMQEWHHHGKSLTISLVDINTAGVCLQITVAVVRYESLGIERSGVASVQLADRLEVISTIKECCFTGFLEGACSPFGSSCPLCPHHTPFPSARFKKFYVQITALSQHSALPCCVLLDECANDQAGHTDPLRIQDLHVHH